MGKEKEGRKGGEERRGIMEEGREGREGKTKRKRRGK